MPQEDEIFWKGKCKSIIRWKKQGRAEQIFSLHSLGPGWSGAPGCEAPTQGLSPQKHDCAFLELFPPNS